MSNKTLRALSGVALGVLVTLGLWTAFATGFKNRMAGDLQRIAAEASLKLQRAIGRIDAAGARARDRLVKDRARFDEISNVFLTAANESGGVEAGLNAVGVVDLTLNRDGWTLRRSRISGPPLEEPGRVVETLRRDAVRAAQLTPLPSSAETGSPAPLLIASGLPDRRFWIVWRDLDGRKAFAALFDFTPTIESLAASGLKDLTFGQFNVGEARRSVLSDAEAMTSQVAFGLGGEIVQTELSAQAPGRFAFDRAVAGPMSVFAVMIFGVLYLLSRGQRRREAELRLRQRAIIESIAAKQTELDESEARFRHLAESTNVIPWRADLDNNRFSYIGPQIEALTGYPASTWRAEGFWMQHVLPKDRQRIRSEAAEKAKDGAYFSLDYRIRDAQGGVLHITNMLSVSRRPREGGGVSLIAQGFMLDVTARIKAEEELQRARAAAERANDFKSAFLATMSHELRTPLNAVIGFSEIMKDQLFGPLDPQYQEYASNVHASGKHLLKLINDILDLSKIEAGRFEIHDEPTDVEQLIHDCRSIMQERLASAELETQIQLQPGLPMVMMDERRIKQVILNLMSNAMKFTEAGGSISMIASRRPGEGLVISVRDTGIGMAPEEIPQALENFGQIDGELSRRHDGTGLGLPIARSLTQLHGGDLTIDSELGRGTTVSLHLPEDRILEDTGDDAQRAVQC